VEKSSASARRLFECRYRRVAQNELCHFIGHVMKLRKLNAGVYSERSLQSVGQTAFSDRNMACCPCPAGGNLRLTIRPA
jgi:hypothetical protein